MNTLESLSMNQLDIIINDIDRQIEELQKQRVGAVQLRDQYVLKTTKPADGSSPIVGTFLKSRDVEKAILSIDGVFYAKDVPAAIGRMFPGKYHHSKSAIPNALNKLTKIEKKLEYVEEKSGQSPASYRRKTKH